MADTLRVFTFGPGHGLPTTGPFGLKLELALRIAGIPYTRVQADDPRKGPKRKSPWIEQGGVRMGDTSLILDHLGVDLDAHLSPADRATSVAWRALAEERWHQVVEYELFLHPAGFATLDAEIARAVPRLLAPIVGWMFRRMFRRHLVERGIARHTPEEVAVIGRRDLDAIATLVDGRRFALGDQPSTLDCTLFGLLALPLCSPAPTPCYAHAKSLPALVAYWDGLRAAYFPEIPALAPASERRRNGTTG